MDCGVGSNLLQMVAMGEMKGGGGEGGQRGRGERGKGDLISYQVKRVGIV